MSLRWISMGVALLCVLGGSSSCRFEPDLSRFEPCAEDGACAPGYTCLAEARRCLPDCGPEGACFPEPPADAATDAGPFEDGGTDAGPDAGPPALTLVTEVLEPGIEEKPYVAELQAQGGTPPYQFRATEPLPDGLTLDGGILSGTLPPPGTIRVAVEVSDEAEPPVSSSAVYELRVRPEQRVAGPSILVQGYQGSFYSEKVSATGGVPPYSFEFESGSLPPGVTLLSDGSVAGTPPSSASGTYRFKVKVVDSDPQRPQMTVRELQLPVSGSPLGLTISTHTVPDARVGTQYQYVLRCAPSSSVTWKLQAGALPNGIGFNASTATLAGTPLDPGVWSFTIHVTDGLLGNAERTFTLTVY